ncbi:MAG: hypothetical protein ABJN26_20135 [Stappiaceae bacterium]
MASLTQWLSDFGLPILLVIWFALFVATIKFERWRGSSSFSGGRAGAILFAVGFLLFIAGVVAALIAQPQTAGDLSLLDFD